MTMAVRSSFRFWVLEKDLEVKQETGLIGSRRGPEAACQKLRESF